MLFLQKSFWLTILKLAALAFVGAMIFVQIPELRYDMGPKTPVPVTGPEALTRDRFPRATFVSVEGVPDFRNGFVYKRYGLTYTYFNIQPYGMKIVARTYEKVTDEWKTLNRFLGKLRPFNRQPFHYRIRQIYRDRFEIEVPRDAFFLALDDVPDLSAWQVGAVCLASVLWLVLFYMFFFYRKPRPAPGPTG